MGLCAAIAVASLMTTMPAAARVQVQAPSPAAELDRAEAAWRAVAPDSYTITLVVNAFVPPPRGPFTFRVERGAARVLGTAPGPVVAAVYDRHATVDRLFEVIRTALSREPFRQSITYHPTLGYPVSIDIDPRRDVFHDEISVQVLDLRADAPLPGWAPGPRQAAVPGRPAPPVVPAGPPPAAVSSTSVVTLPVRPDVRDAHVSEFVALVPVTTAEGRCEVFPVSFGPGQRALFYGFGPERRPTRRITVVLDDQGRVLRYSDGRGDLRAPMDPSVSPQDPLGSRTSIAIDWIAQTGVLTNTPNGQVPAGVRATGPDVLDAPNLGSPATMVAEIRARCERP